MNKINIRYVFIHVNLNNTTIFNRKSIKKGRAHKPFTLIHLNELKTQIINYGLLEVGR